MPGHRRGGRRRKKAILGRWAFFRFEVGLTDDEFWGATDEELEALQKCWFDKERREDARVARHLAFHANLNRDRKKKTTPYTERDFLPRTEEEREADKMQEMKDFLDNHKTLFKRVN